MTEPKQKVRYNYEFLQKYCEENNITLLKDYSNEKVNRDTKIEAKCISENCEYNTEKAFRLVVENGGCYCKTHTKENQYNKIKNSDWNKSNKIRYNEKYLNVYVKKIMLNY